MMNSLLNATCIRAGILLALLFGLSELSAQDWQLVWADEFAGIDIDHSRWNLETGPTAGTLHYFTDRPDNAKIVNGKLQILALKEAFQGFEYTAALLTTKTKFSWRYGRIESRMKLPKTTGFVPGFWLLPQNDQYGFWPWSGEIDIMEHPTNQDRIFGTCHTWQYSYFTGSLSPAGGSIRIPDSETTFHIYAAQWTPDKIEFFVDNEKYYTFVNDHSGYKVWPFDQPFYVLLAMGVGGGWVGNPNKTTVFPGILEVDYVRVYQNLSDLVIYGDDYVLSDSRGVVYSLPRIEGASYHWSLPNGASITAGSNTHSITVDWGIFGGLVTAEVTIGDHSYRSEYSVIVSANLIKNAGFEKSVKYWNKNSPHPGESTFALTSDQVHGGDYSMYVDINAPGVNAWDIQLSQGNLPLKSKEQYHASFWAKKDGASANISMAVINSSDYTLYAVKSITITGAWQQFELNFTAPANATAAFNVDMGGKSGKFYFDDFALTMPTTAANQLMNADFSSARDGWIFNAFSPAQASAAVENGELSISISNGGVYTWDIFVGQAGVTMEQGKEYTLSFDAYATGARNIFAFVGKNSSPWNVYSGNKSISLSTKRQTYSLSFIMNDPTDRAARVGFDIGASKEDIVLDNVFLSMGRWPAAVTRSVQESPGSFQLLQNSPNPFNTKTTIKYELPEAALITLDIYDVNGKLVENLLQSYALAGTRSVQWDGTEFASGTYFYKLSTENFIQVKKMVLIK